MPEMRGKKSGKGDYTLRRGKASNSGTDTHQQRGAAHHGLKCQKKVKVVFSIQMWTPLKHLFIHFCKFSLI